jgi:hypothetical protein
MKAQKIDAARLACLAVAAIVVAGLAFFASRSLAAPQPQGAPAAQAAPAGQTGQGAPPAARGGGGFRHPDAIDFDDHDGFVSLFDGATLGGWIGDADYWSVKDGAIYANSTCERPTGTIYIYWTGGVAGDFQLKMQMKGTGNVNSGIQYRSWLAIDPNSPKPPARGRGPAGPGPGRAVAPAGAPTGGAAAAAARGGAGGRGPQCANPGTPPGRDPNKAEAEDKFNMGGPQYDFDNTDMYPAQFYEQSTGRGIIAWPGEVVEADPGKPPRLLAKLADDATLHTWFNKNDWNQEVVVASGHTYTHILNGHVVSILIDYNPMWFQSSGHIGVEIESTGEVFFKDVWLKKFN